MNTIEKIDRALEEWVHNLRSSLSDHELQPKDVLHSILKALEDNRIEGLDNQQYAPNVYIVELNLNTIERERLMPFLGREELETAIRNYCEKNKYQFRGPLELRVVATQHRAPVVSEEVTDETEKVHVECHYEVKDNAREAPAANTLDWETPDPPRPVVS